MTRSIRGRLGDGTRNFRSKAGADITMFAESARRISRSLVVPNPRAASSPQNRFPTRYSG